MRSVFIVALFLSFGFPFSGIRAQTPYPAGLFCSCPPTMAAGSGSVLPSLTGKEFLAGFLVRVAWKDIEPQKDSYAWALLDSQFVRAQRAGKQVALAIVNGGQAPEWLYTGGARSFSFLFRSMPSLMPVPWDSVYLREWTTLIQLIGERYRGIPNLALVHITHATANGFEMQLPFTPADQSNWRSIGYSHQRVLESWTEVMDAFRDAFPSTPLDVDLHPVLGSDSVSRGVVDYGYSSIGPRFGVFAAWWSQKNTVTYAPQYQLLRSGVDSSFAAVQLVASGTTDSAQFGDGGMPAALDLAVRDGIRYWEVWNQDLLNPAFETLFRQLAGSQTGMQRSGVFPGEMFLSPVYPNPVTSQVVIRYSLVREQAIHLDVVDILGRDRRSLFDGIAQPGSRALAGAMAGLPRGMYFVRLRNAGAMKLTSFFFAP